MTKPNNAKTNMSKEKEIENLQNKLKYWKKCLLEYLLYPDVHKGELEIAATMVADILYRLRTVYGIKE